MDYARQRGGIANTKRAVGHVAHVHVGHVAGVRRLLFAPAGDASPPAGVETFTAWSDVAAAVLESYGQ